MLAQSFKNLITMPGVKKTKKISQMIIKINHKNSKPTILTRLMTITTSKEKN